MGNNFNLFVTNFNFQVTGALLAWMQNKQEAAGFLVSGSAPHKYSPKYPPNFLQNILPNIFPISSQKSLQIFFQLFSQYPSKYPPKYCLKYPTNFLYPTSRICESSC